MTLRKTIGIFLIISGITLTGCASGNNSISSKITIEPKTKIENPEISSEDLLAKLKESAAADDYETFGDALAKVYEFGWEGEEDFLKTESEYYVQATKYFEDGDTNKALEIANSIFAKVYEGWRFKYLKVRALEKLGTDAFAADDLAKAEEFAKQIMAIEFRPEGVNLMAKINIRQATNEIENGNNEKAKQILLLAKDMDIDEGLRTQINDLIKKLE